MGSPTTATWTPGIIYALTLQYLTPESMGDKSAYFAYYFINVLAMCWLQLADKHVPEPYLDEIFHVPQAQLYCEGRYDYWDPKLTTPPGLYVFATLFNVVRRASCTVLDLRLFNSFMLPILFVFATACRQLIKSPDSPLRTTRNAIHTGMNIALFPPLFFFSGLFYTDLLSTCTILVTYLLYLRNTPTSRLAILPVGLIALTLRQTNIFWVAIFFGGLEAVRTLESGVVKNAGTAVPPARWKERIVYEFTKWSRGEIHDTTIEQAAVHDFLLSATSIAIAILCQPLRAISRLWPYLGLLGCFIIFIYWNGGVVLGDKSNHVATIHLPQLLYLLAFTVYFSLPLVLSPTINFIISLRSLLDLPTFPRLKLQYMVASGYCLGALGATLLIIKFNTIVHPFTLADNRHYMFYVFRYTILKHPLIRYILAPIYLSCGWAAYLTLCRPPAYQGKETNYPNKPDSATSVVTVSKPSPTAFSKLDPSSTPMDMVHTQLVDRGSEGPKISFLLIFLVTTALSLMTAPLVEPRYFIVPWVVWRLHVPNLQPSEPKTGQGNRGNQVPTRWSATFSRIIKSITYQNHDYRLWLETLWFIIINVVTGYIFLYRGFTWPQEPGKTQRFMW